MQKGHAKSFKEYLAEGEADLAKPNAAKEESPEKSDDKLTQLFGEIEDTVQSCIDSLESLHIKMEGTSLSQSKIYGIIADLKGYQQNVHDEGEISNQSNQST